MSNVSPGKARRTWLFKASRPTVRPFEAKDRGFLWVAHLAGVFGLPAELTQEQFLVEMAKRFQQYPLMWLVEDDSQKFRSGRGPVALVGIKTDGWAFEPTPLWFPWARKRHILRGCVAFLQMIRYAKDVGCCIIHATKEQKSVLEHMQKYGVLYPRGRIPNGCSVGDVFLFSVNGKKIPLAVTERMAA